MNNAIQTKAKGKQKNQMNGLESSESFFFISKRETKPINTANDPAVRNILNEIAILFHWIPFQLSNHLDEMSR